MKILWFLDKELDVSLSKSARLATIANLEKNNDLTVVTSYRHQKIFFEDIKSQIIYLDTYKFAGMKRFSLYCKQVRYCQKYLNGQKYDVVMVNSLNYLLLQALYYLNIPKKFKIVFDVRTLPVDANQVKRVIDSFLFFQLLKNAAKYCDGITYITEEMRQYCHEKASLSKHNSEVWSSGVDTEIFKDNKDMPEKTCHQILKIIYHGTIAKNRNISSVVRAVSLLKNEIPVYLSLLGSGEGLIEIRSLIETLHLSDNVIVLDAVDHQYVPKIICDHDLGILPFQQFDGWNTSSPIKLFEYLSCERPVIVTEITPHKQVLGENNFAFWARDSSPEAISQAIRQAYLKRHDFKKLGSNARKFVEDKFTWSKQINKLETFLQYC